MDQGFSDIGWGCMYRACQTLISWLRLQGYIDYTDEIPSIPQIQKMLDQIDISKKISNTQ